jgi:hypothetical protein
VIRRPSITGQRLRTVATLSLALLLIAPVSAQVTLTEGTNLTAHLSPPDGRIAMDLLGSIWILPPGGGAAQKVSNGLQPAARPRWSPQGDKILYQTASVLGSRIWLLQLNPSASTTLSDGSDFDQHPEWHPSGKRIVFSSARGERGFDLYEMHLATGLSWRLTDDPGDETEPAWSANGRDLAYIRRRGDQWALLLRKHGQRERELVVSDEPLAAPAWRPDGSLLTFFRRDGRKYSLDMAILSEPPLVRPLATDEDFFLSPVSWSDRLHFFYTADGVIKSRGINDWMPKQVPFRAEVHPPEMPPEASLNVRDLSVVSPSNERLVIRAARLFDGVSSDYRRNIDVLIDDGLVVAVDYRREWDDATVLDLGDATILPGFIDSYAALPEGNARELGLALLSYGVTTIVADAAAGFDASIWETERSPGPRLLTFAPLGATESGNDTAPLALLTIPESGVIATGGSDGDAIRVRSLPLLAESWRIGVAVGAELLLGADTMPASPAGRRYRDLRLTAGAGPATLVSGLADGGTPGLRKLLRSRQAKAFEHWMTGQGAPRRFPEGPDLSRASSVVVGSKPNGFPPGLALHAELRALAAAGLRGDEVLKAAGANAGDALGHRSQLGRVVPGALADFVLVAGDPVSRISDAIDIVAVVRNGRFYSLVRLLEEARAAADVD